MNLFVVSYKYMGFFNSIILKIVSVFPSGAVSLPLICLLCAGHSCLANTWTLRNWFQGLFLWFFFFFLLMPKLPGSVVAAVGWQWGGSKLSFVLWPPLTHSIHHPEGSKPAFHRAASPNSLRLKGNDVFSHYREKEWDLKFVKLWCSLCWFFSFQKNITLL